MTEAEVARVLGELGKLWGERGNDGRFAEIGVLNLRYGLMGGPQHDHEKIAGLLRLEPERVREIESELLARLARAASII